MVLLALFLLDEIDFQLSPKGKRKRRFRLALTKSEQRRLMNIGN